jgi:predicted GNAT family acetyltransferase
MDVTNNRAERRFELMTDAGPAVAAYEVDGDTIVFTHTVVPREAGGQGVGSRLIAGALEQVRAEGVKIVPQCAFVRAFVERHAEWRDLLA